MRQACHAQQFHIRAGDVVARTSCPRRRAAATSAHASAPRPNAAPRRLRHLDRSARRRQSVLNHWLARHGPPITGTRLAHQRIPFAQSLNPHSAGTVRSKQRTASADLLQPPHGECATAHAGSACRNGACYGLAVTRLADGACALSRATCAAMSRAAGRARWGCQNPRVGQRRRARHLDRPAGAAAWALRSALPSPTGRRRRRKESWSAALVTPDNFRPTMACSPAFCNAAARISEADAEPPSTSTLSGRAGARRLLFVLGRHQHRSACG